MAEKRNNKEDLFLAELFSSEPIADDGFSERITSRIRRQLWFERLTLPIAVVIGAGFAFRPLTSLVEMLGQLSPAQSLLPFEIPALSLSELVSTQNLLMVGLLVCAGVLIYQFAED